MTNGRRGDGRCGFRCVLLWTVLGLVGIVVVYLGARLTINLVDQARAEQVADRAYAQVLPEVEEWSADVRRALEPTLGAPVGWRREVACGVTAQIGGWFPQDYSHACTLRHTLVFPVADEREAWAAPSLPPDDPRGVLPGKPHTAPPTPRPPPGGSQTPPPPPPSPPPGKTGVCGGVRACEYSCGTKPPI